MADITAIKVGNDQESIHELYPRNNEFKKRSEDEINSLPEVTAETWTFTLDDDTTVTKQVVVNG